MKLPIYFDNHATTPVDQRVVDAMLPFFTQQFGNSASKHAFGWEADAAVYEARRDVGSLIAAAPKEIIFTSGATESNNLAIQGIAGLNRDRGNHIITCAAEHKAVLDCCKFLERQGFRVTYLPVDSRGMVDIDRLSASIDNGTVLISIMLANNEVGTIQPLAEIGRIAEQSGVIFHTDATQAVGKMPIDVATLGVHLLSMTAHKLHGPKGIGALYVKAKKPPVRLSPIIYGGGHEGGARSGTLNVPGIVGFGKACEIAREEMATEPVQVARLRDRLEVGLFSHLDDIYLNGHPTERLYGNLNVAFGYVEGESLIMGLHDVAVSSGSTCTSADLEPSHVLKAMGVREDLAHGSIRFGLGRFNSEEEVDYVVGRVEEEVTRLRGLSPLYAKREGRAEATAGN